MLALAEQAKVECRVLTILRLAMPQVGFSLVTLQLLKGNIFLLNYWFCIGECVFEPPQMLHIGAGSHKGSLATSQCRSPSL